MTTTTAIALSPAPAEQPWRRWQRHAYGYREAAFAILVFGIYLHMSRLVFGADLVQLNLLLPRVDEVFGIAMAYAAGAAVAGWQALRFRGVWHRRMSKFIAGFIMVSAPVHLAAFFSARRRHAWELYRGGTAWWRALYCIQSSRAPCGVSPARPMRPSANLSARQVREW